MRTGDRVFVCVTDHPDFPAATHEGDSGYFRDEPTAQRIADAWNSHYTNSGTPQPYPWRVEPRVLRGRRQLDATPDEQFALGL
jgi:hypothetical protein